MRMWGNDSPEGSHQPAPGRRSRCARLGVSTIFRGPLIPRENTSDLTPIPLAQPSGPAEDEHYGLPNGGHLPKPAQGATKGEPAARAGCPIRAVHLHVHGPQVAEEHFTRPEALPTASLCPGPVAGHCQGQVSSLASISQRSSCKPSGGGGAGSDWWHSAMLYLS